jgi:hypothetical protein
METLKGLHRLRDKPITLPIKSSDKVGNSTSDDLIGKAMVCIAQLVEPFNGVHLMSRECTNNERLKQLGYKKCCSDPFITIHEV